MRLWHLRGNSMPDHKLTWIKASASISNGACVELAADQDSVLMRHSRQPDLQIRYTHEEMAAFFDGVKNHEFDHLLDRH